MAAKLVEKRTTFKLYDTTFSILLIISKQKPDIPFGYRAFMTKYKSDYAFLIYAAIH